MVGSFVAEKILVAGFQSVSAIPGGVVGFWTSFEEVELDFGHPEFILDNYGVSGSRNPLATLEIDLLLWFLELPWNALY